MYLFIEHFLLFLQEVHANQDSIICLDCSNKLREAFDFKTMCIETEDMLVPFTDTQNGNELDVAKVFTTDISKDTPEEMNFCRLCRNLNEVKSMVSFIKFLEDPKIMGLFERHIPEMVCEISL